MIDCAQRITLPLPPSANRYWRKTKSGRVYVSDQAKDYRRTIRVLARIAKVREVEGPVGMEMRVYRAQKAGDLDNFCKVLWDALQGHCYADDGQIVEAHLFRFDDPLRPRLELRWWPAGEILFGAE